MTKTGNRRVRWLLVEAAWQILRSKSPQTLALRAWTVQIAHRRGKRIAVVALRAAWPASSTRCGGMTCRTTRSAFGRCHRPPTNARDKHSRTRRESS
ncbi:MAG: hypothetical protein IPP20_06140 [Gemmatimonadetes bacterium]|nr:hypothetical protein [Gemmatimonadota bacterium]